MDLAIPVAAGLVLAVAAGLRAFLPLAALSWAVRAGLFDPGESFQWIASDAALIGFSSAVVFELIADKFPAVDHFFDSIGVVVKPLAGALIMFVTLGDLHPFYVIVIGLAIGGGAAETVHLAKAKGRILANVTTLGFAAPVLSVIEDLIAFGLVAAAMLVPLLAVTVVAVLVLFVIKRFRRTEPV